MCIRIDSFESEEAQKIVRSYLNGRFANTAFCLLAPDGKERLSRSHRGPNHVLGPDLAAGFDRISKKYPSKAPAKKAAVPDFPNFRLGLNVASADQRLLVLVTGNEKQLKVARKSLPAVSNDADIIGRFQYDFESDSKTWKKSLTGNLSSSSIKIILPDEFGQKGRVMASLPLNSSTEAVKAALLKANKEFAEKTDKKNYRQHVQKGRRQGIEWTMPMEFGEDRDGDGVIDHRGGQRRR